MTVYTTLVIKVNFIDIKIYVKYEATHIECRIKSHCWWHESVQKLEGSVLSISQSNQNVGFSSSDRLQKPLFYELLAEFWVGGISYKIQRKVGVKSPCAATPYASFKTKSLDINHFVSRAVLEKKAKM